MKIDEKFMNYKLCFVDSEEWAGDPITLYFTELDDVTEQWGDDWNDRPYEHNAGEPYENDYSQTWRAYSTIASCMPRHKPRKGTLCSLAYWQARIFPSTPLSPKPPGTKMPCTPPRISSTFSSVNNSVYSSLYF